MANWLSMQSTAEKYGIPEEQIREWIRLDYVTYSSFLKEILVMPPLRWWILMNLIKFLNRIPLSLVLMMKPLSEFLKAI